MFSKLFGKNYTRKKLLKNTSSPVMKDFYGLPFPENKEFISYLNIVSLDFETTGLDVEACDVVSFGSVNISRLGVDLASCLHQLINIKGELTEQSVVIHQITDSAVASGVRIEEAMPTLLKKLSGGVLLAHNARIELGFLNKMCQKLYDTDFIIPVIDTQYLAKRSLERINKSHKSNDLRLFNLRKSFNMPAHKAHNALLDAISTAELFLAMLSKISPQNDGRLGDFIS